MNRSLLAVAAGASLIACGQQPDAEIAPTPSTTDAPPEPSSTEATTSTSEPTSTTNAPETTTVTSAPPQRPVTTLYVPPTTEAPILPERAQDDLTDIEWAIHAAFGSDGAAAVRVARCESGLNPGAVNGAHAGLFQLSGTYHRERAARLGYSWSDMFTVFGNVAVAYDLFAEQGWRPWTCKP